MNCWRKNHYKSENYRCLFNSSIFVSLANHLLYVCCWQQFQGLCNELNLSLLNHWHYGFSFSFENLNGIHWPLVNKATLKLAKTNPDNLWDCFFCFGSFHWKNCCCIFEMLDSWILNLECWMLQLECCPQKNECHFSWRLGLLTRFSSLIPDYSCKFYHQFVIYLYYRLSFSFPMCVCVLEVGKWFYLIFVKKLSLIKPNRKSIVIHLSF